MAIGQALTLALALLAMACLPVAVAVLIWADVLFDRFSCRVAELRCARRQRRVISWLNRSLEADSVVRGFDLTQFDRLGQPTVEQIAADLRRLGGQRLGVASRSRMWQLAVLQAYDDRLRQASRCLGVVEYLGDLDGVDLEIERLRVEGQLQADGLNLLAGPTEHGRGSR